jgi:DNA-binding transcriptional MerR regulator
MPDDDRYSLTELADLAGVTPRTVRYYLAQGLLPATGQSGPGSKYDARHLARLRLVRRLQGEHLPLAEIRRRLDELDDDEIRDLAGADAPPPPAGTALDYVRSILGGGSSRSGTADRAPALVVRATPAASNTLAEPLGVAHGSTPAAAPAALTASTAPAATPIERSQWERIVLVPDVELHIRRPLSRVQNKGVDRLVTIARELLEEGRP